MEDTKIIINRICDRIINHRLEKGYNPFELTITEEEFQKIRFMLHDSNNLEKHDPPTFAGIPINIISDPFDAREDYMSYPSLRLYPDIDYDYLDEYLDDPDFYDDDDDQDYWKDHSYKLLDDRDYYYDDDFYRLLESEEDAALDHSAEVASMACGVKQTAKKSCKCFMCKFAKNSIRNKAKLRNINKSFRRESKIKINQGIYEMNIAPCHYKYLS